MTDIKEAVEHCAEVALDQLRASFRPDGCPEPESFTRNVPTMRTIIQSAIYEALAKLDIPDEVPKEGTATAKPPTRQ